MRDALVHFDEWARGEGSGPQKKDVLAGKALRDVASMYWAFAYDPEKDTITLGPYVVQVDTAVRRYCTGRRHLPGRAGRALGVFSHAVLVLRWFREAAAVHVLARDNGIGISTCYRYLHEAITVLAAEAPELSEVLRERLAVGDTHVILDGTLIRSDRVAATTDNEKGNTINLWYSGKHKAFGGNVQFLSTAERVSLVVRRGVSR
jgi:hypothetical protein